MLRLSLSFLFSALTTALTADLICCSRWGEGTNALLPPSPGSPPVSVFAIRDTTYTQTKQRRPPLPPPSPPTFRCSVARGPFIIIIIRFGGDSAFFSFSYSAWVPLFFEKGRSPPPARAPRLYSALRERRRGHHPPSLAWYIACGCSPRCDLFDVSSWGCGALAPARSCSPLNDSSLSFYMFRFSLCFSLLLPSC